MIKNKGMFWGGIVILLSVLFSFLYALGSEYFVSQTTALMIISITFIVSIIFGGITLIILSCNDE